VLIAAIRRRQRRAGLTESAVRPGGSAVVVRGGARIGWLNSSWPLAVLTFDESSAELRILLLSPMVVRRDEVIRVARRRGVWRFETASGRWDHITFGASGVGDALRQRGWPVER
jgi:hypothetical protein